MADLVEHQALHRARQHCGGVDVEDVCAQTLHFGEDFALAGRFLLGEEHLALERVRQAVLAAGQEHHGIAPDQRLVQVAQRAHQIGPAVEQQGQILEQEESALGARQHVAQRGQRVGQRGIGRHAVLDQPVGERPGRQRAGCAVALTTQLAQQMFEPGFIVTTDVEDGVAAVQALADAVGNGL